MITEVELADLTQAILGATATCGNSIVLTIDGPAGSGKTTLAAALENRIASSGRSAMTIHLDDIYNGWEDALGASLTRNLAEKVIPGITTGHSFLLPRFDWAISEYSNPMIYLPSEIVIIEGVGAGQSAIREFATLAIWIYIDSEVGMARVLARDGQTVKAHMRQFQRAQNEHFLNEGSELAADYRLNGAP
ncbi:MAG: adenylyl-sulfate kinase [Actinomycetes bacterium]